MLCNWIPPPPRFTGAVTAVSSLKNIQVAACLWLLCGCLDRPIGVPVPVTTNVFATQLTQTSVDKIDLLFMIDNSASMSDKQLTLEAAVPDLVDRLVNPICIDASGAPQPAAPPGEDCPLGQRREFRPITDINIAVVSSSLGDAGANDACTTGAKIDGGRLIGSMPRAASAGANAAGFLTWRPGTELNRFKENFQRMVRSVGEDGCGWEASLESWYRFLVDPIPFAALERVACTPGDEEANCVDAVRDSNGLALLDNELLQQRAEFLRPDSLVAIILLTDENDCSIQVGGLSWLMGTLSLNNRPVPMFASSTACAEDPNAECCYSCLQQPPSGCEWAHSSCEEGQENQANRLSFVEDSSNLRCFDQKRRFGIDFLYPTQRYVNALTNPQLCPSQPDLSIEDCPGAILPNPLYAGGRPKNNIFLAGITGVPWQQIAATTNANGSSLAANELRYKTASELSDDDWASILGDPQASPPVAPTLPLMQESPWPRTGVLTGGPNGREYDTVEPLTSTPSELQYSCIFPLTQPRDCQGKSLLECDCAGDDLRRPLCEKVPGQSTASTTQHWAKAFPGLRQLEVLKGFGDNSIVASICARNVDDPTAPDYGYRPAISSLVDRLKEQLVRRCLPRALDVDENGAVPCTLIEARPAETSCACDSTLGRSTPNTQSALAARRQLLTRSSELCAAGDPDCNNPCLCEVAQITEEPARSACQNDPEPSMGEGFCYIADSPGQSIGNPALVAECAPTERRLLRFVGSGQAKGSVTVVSCLGQSYAQQ